MPKAAPPANTSPLSLSRMRWYLGIWERRRPSLLCRFFAGHGLAYFEARESRDGNILAQFGDFPFDEIANRGGVVFDEGLLEQADFFIEFVEAAFDDLLDHFL